MLLRLVAARLSCAAPLALPLPPILRQYAAVSLADTLGVVWDTDATCIAERAMLLNVRAIFLNIIVCLFGWCNTLVKTVLLQVAINN